MPRRCGEMAMALWEAAAAATCVLGLGGALWWLLGRLLRPVENGSMVAVLPARGTGEGLEQAVRLMIWLRSLGLLNCPVVIADLGLNGAGRDVALRLAARWPDVMLWPAGQLAEYMEFLP